MEYVSSVSWLLGWEPCSGWLHLSVIVVAQESKVSIRCYVGGWCWWAVATPPPLTDAGRLVVAPHHTTTTMFCVVSQFSYTDGVQFPSRPGSSHSHPNIMWTSYIQRCCVILSSSEVFGQIKISVSLLEKSVSFLLHAINAFNAVKHWDTCFCQIPIVELSRQASAVCVNFQQCYVRVIFSRIARVTSAECTIWLQCPVCPDQDYHREVTGAGLEMVGNLIRSYSQTLLEGTIM